MSSSCPSAICRDRPMRRAFSIGKILPLCEDGPSAGAVRCALPALPSRAGQWLNCRSRASAARDVKSSFINALGLTRRPLWAAETAVHGVVPGKKFPLCGPWQVSVNHSCLAFIAGGAASSGRVWRPQLCFALIQPAACALTRAGAVMATNEAQTDTEAMCRRRRRGRIRKAQASAQADPHGCRRRLSFSAASALAPIISCSPARARKSPRRRRWSSRRRFSTCPKCWSTSRPRAAASAPNI